MTIDLPVHVDLLETDARLAWRIVDANGVTVPWGTVAAALNTPPRNAGVSDDVELFQVLSVPGGETMTIKYPVTAAGIFVNDADGEPSEPSPDKRVITADDVNRFLLSLPQEHRLALLVDTVDEWSRLGADDSLLKTLLDVTGID